MVPFIGDPSYNFGMTGKEAIRIINGLGISQAMFARLVGITPVAVNKWTRGHPPSPPVAALLRLLDARPELVPVLQSLAPVVQKSRSPHN